VFVSAIRVGKMDSRGPVPDMMRSERVVKCLDGQMDRSTRAEQTQIWGTDRRSGLIPNKLEFKKKVERRYDRNYTVPSLHDLSDSILSIIFLRVKHLNHPPPEDMMCDKLHSGQQSGH
jgi:hypothetical protein